MTDTEIQLRDAKQKLSQAAAACLRNEPNAARQADLAFAEVTGLQAIESASGARECAAPGCTTWTLKKHCSKHRQPEPAGPWLIAQQLWDE